MHRRPVSWSRRNSRSSACPREWRSTCLRGQHWTPRCAPANKNLLQPFQREWVAVYMNNLRAGAFLLEIRIGPGEGAQPTFTVHAGVEVEAIEL